MKKFRMLLLLFVAVFSFGCMAPYTAARARVVGPRVVYVPVYRNASYYDQWIYSPYMYRTPTVVVRQPVVRQARPAVRRRPANVRSRARRPIRLRRKP